jgi:hypothetical protein
LFGCDVLCHQASPIHVRPLGGRHGNPAKRGLPENYSAICSAGAAEGAESRMLR